MTCWPGGAAPFITKYLREVSPGAKGGEIRIKNLAGGQGLQAHTAIYNAKPDGYTIGNINSGSIYDYVTGVTKAPFDPFKFTPLFSALRTTRVIVSGKKGATTWEELLQLSKKRPLKWAIGTLTWSNIPSLQRSCSSWEVASSKVQPP